MKRILLFIGVISLLTTTGCLVAEGGHHGHAEYHGPPVAVVGPPVVVVGPPVVVVRPPEVVVPVVRVRVD